MHVRKERAVGLGVLVLATVAGCAPAAQYIYRPEQNATASVAGRPAALYQIPPEAPRGDVRIAALGIATLQPQGGGTRVRAMHLRMIVDDNDDAAWTADTREQIGVLDGAGQSRPAFAATSRGQPPAIEIPAGGSVTIDLFYPVPAAMQSASQVPHFHVVWHVHTPARVVAERTSFERLRIETAAPPSYVYAMTWWGPGWWGPVWYDPLWPRFGFSGAVVLPPVYYMRPVIVARPSASPRQLAPPAIARQAAPPAHQSAPPARRIR
jgi:hypothetical protein